MKFDPRRHHRRSIRLKGFDYTQPGAYFVTICAQNRECLFGNIVDGEMVLNQAGQTIAEEWQELTRRFPTLRLDEFVVMPNHFHAVLFITEGDVGNMESGVGTHSGAGTRPAPTDGVTPNDTVGASFMGAPIMDAPDMDTPVTDVIPTLGDIIGAFKSITTHKYIQGVHNRGWPGFDRRLWQRNYYEHIVRNENELRACRQYIIHNPAKWDVDRENPTNVPTDKKR